MQQTLSPVHLEQLDFRGVWELTMWSMRYRSNEVVRITVKRQSPQGNDTNIQAPLLTIGQLIEFLHQWYAIDLSIGKPCMVSLKHISPMATKLPVVFNDVDLLEVLWAATYAMLETYP